MNNTIPLEYGKYYHVYNRGINSCELFSEKANYEYFLRLYDKYIPLIADTYAWCLMGNHLACPAGRFSFVSEDKGRGRNGIFTS